MSTTATPTPSSSAPAPTRRVWRAAAAVLTGVALLLGMLVVLMVAPAPSADAAEVRAKRRHGVLVVRGRDFARGRRGRVVARIQRRNGNYRRAVVRVRTNPRNGRFVVRRQLKARDTGRIVTRVKVGRKTRVRVVKPTRAHVLNAQKTTKTGKGGSKTTTSEPTTSEPTTDDATETVAYGVDPAYTPVGDVTVAVGTLSQSLLDKHPEGTRFVIAAGKHRLAAPLKPRARQQLLGMPGAVLSGSKVVTGWVSDGSRWYVDGQTQQFAIVPEYHPTLGIKYCADDSPMCRYPEAVFRNGRDLRQVASLAELAPGTFFFDYAADRIYVADDPTGALMEATRTQHAVNGGGSGVRIQNLVIEQFATPTQTPAMVDGASGGWHLIDNEIRHAHAAGARIAGTDVVVHGNYIHSNGQIGLKVQGSGGLVHANRIAHNNTQGYRQGFESGGTKFAYTTNLVVRANWVHDNIGNGLWTDIDNIYTIHEDNLVERNAWKGIFHEISYDAIIRNNTVRGNGWKAQYWFDGAGIHVANSRNVEIYGNILEGNLSGITGRQDGRWGPGKHGDWDLKNLYVHHNVVKHALTRNTAGITGFAAGVASYEGSTSATFTSKNNRYVGNSYTLSSTSAKNFGWKSGARTLTEWRSFGHDL